MKYCIGCKQLRYEPAMEGYHYSELTWDTGSPPEMARLKGHWKEVLNGDFTQQKLEAAMESAQMCPDYEKRS